LIGVADHAEDRDSPPPLELTLTWQIEKFGAAAVWNGRIPFYLLKQMSVAKNVYDALMSYKAGSNNLAQWSEANPGATALIAYIRTLRARYPRIKQED